MMETVIITNDTIVDIPLCIIDNFFTNYRLDESKLTLDQIRSFLFNRNYPYLLGSVDHDNVIHFLEKIEELIDAAHLINKD